MLLYHYNTKRLPILASQFARGVNDVTVDNGEDMKSPFYYGKNLSFFFEPIPDNIGTILHQEHHFWKRGQVVYEHIIDLNQLPENVPYRIVETYAKTKLMYEEQPWDMVSIKPELRDEFMEEIRQLEEENGYIGFGREKLREVLSTLPYDIVKDYKDLYKRSKKHPEDKLLEKYGATVPHLMAYVAEHKIKPQSVIKRTLR